MTTNSNTNPNANAISNTFETLDEIIESIEQNNTPDKNLVTHLKSIRKILSQLKDVPGKLKQIPIGFEKKLNELEDACNTQNMEYRAWSSGDNNKNKKKTPADEQISILEAKVMRLMEMLSESNKSKSEQPSKTNSANKQQLKEVIRTFQERMKDASESQPAPNIAPTKPDAQPAVNTAAQNAVTQSAKPAARKAAQTVAKSGELANGEPAKPAARKAAQTVAKSGELANGEPAKPATPTTVNTAAPTAVKPEQAAENAAQTTVNPDSNATLVQEGTPPQYPNNGQREKPNLDGIHGYKKEPGMNPVNVDESSDEDSNGSSKSSTRGGRRLKKTILKRFKSLKTKTTKMTKKTKPTKTTKMTKKTRKNKTHTLRHTQRRRQQHQHIRRRTYKKKPNPKPKRNPKRNRKVNVNVKH
jgi:hypothetical protein